MNFVLENEIGNKPKTVAACRDQGCNDQSVAVIKIARNVSPVSKHIENPPVLVINNSPVVIGFDGRVGKSEAGRRVNHEDNEDKEGPEEKLPSAQETLQALRILKSNTGLNLWMNILHMNDVSNECLEFQKKSYSRYQF
ncbi:hypothetical protein AVEN_66563-1 [Araneus ventricosus]|uniref:Uncharacterized protein n=1 Tax=Araneus ventricosus TaxID=182803 RepID=A0A4Y2EGZ0_ARAVE|nr:hypothetical protein AVEN_66563-1 [Araneus ventricosus]